MATQFCDFFFVSLFFFFPFFMSRILLDPIHERQVFGLIQRDMPISMYMSAKKLLFFVISVQILWEICFLLKFIEPSWFFFFQSLQIIYYMPCV